jgi:anti-sigma B factor antagonist
MGQNGAVRRPRRALCIAVETPDPIIIERTDAMATVRGEIDAYTAPAVREAGESMLASHGSARFDLSGVEFIDSSGLGVLVALTSSARDTGGDVTLVAPSKPVVRLLEISGLDRHLTVSPG